MLRARIYLEGVLPLFEDLVQFDDAAAAAIAGQSLVVQFEVRQGPVAHLDIGAGAISHGTGAHPSPDVRLRFKTPQRLNRQFAGDNVRPRLRKGLRHVRFLLGKFPALAERLGYYMEGEGSQAGDAGTETKEFLVGLRLRALLAGLAAVARHDDWMADIADRCPLGVVAMRVLPDGPRGSLAKVAGNSGYTFVSSHGSSVSRPNTVMEFESLDAAWRVVNGESSFEESASLGEVTMVGNIVLADHMNILSRRLVGVMDF